MNPFLNPIFLCRVLKSGIVDPNRLRRMNNEDIIKYQNKALKAIVKYAYTIPMYKEKYKKIGIHPSDVKEIADIKKLPFITKEDFRSNFPNNVISPSFNRKAAIIAATSGTTGRSLSLYFDLYTVIRSMLGFVRVLKEWDIDWRKTKMSLLLDLTENSFENEYIINSIFSSAKPLIPTRNIQIIDILDPPLDIIRQIECFQPEIIIGYPFVIIQLAVLKSKGYGKNITPRCIGTSGAFFDMYSRKHVEEVFNTKIFDIYAATESGLIAFECRNGGYHVCSDLVYLEYMKNGSDVSFGEPGSLVVTKLYGRGTPLIRYTSIDDVVTPLNNDCTCGLAGGLIQRIHGRKSDSVLLPDGKMAFVSLFENILGESLSEIKVDKIKRIQIVQHKIDSIELKILVDEHLRDVGHPVDKMFSIIKNKLRKRLGPDIKIGIKEVDRFDAKDPYIISKVDRSKFVEKMYLV